VPVEDTVQTDFILTSQSLVYDCVLDDVIAKHDEEVTEEEAKGCNE